MHSFTRDQRHHLDGLFGTVRCTSNFSSHRCCLQDDRCPLHNRCRHGNSIHDLHGDPLLCLFTQDQRHRLDCLIRQRFAVALGHMGTPRPPRRPFLDIGVHLHFAWRFAVGLTSPYRRSLHEVEPYSARQYAVVLAHTGLTSPPRRSLHEVEALLGGLLRHGWRTLGHPRTA